MLNENKKLFVIDDKKMNTPNKLTISRILLTPVFIFLILQFRKTNNHIYIFSSLFVFLVAAFTDMFDGLIARIKKQQTFLGSIIDPIADKILLSSSAIILSLKNHYLFQLPIWYTITVVSRDILIIIGTIVIFLIKEKLIIKPAICGKITTFFQTLVIIWILAGLQYAQIICYTALMFTIISTIHYLITGSKLLNS